MKTLKTVLSVLVIGALLSFMCLPAFAASGSAYSITINNSASGHTYTAYQVFTGTLSGTTLSNIAWGDGISSAAFLTALKADTTFGSGTSNKFSACTSAGDVAAAISDEGFTSAMLEKFAKVALANKSSTDSGWDDDSTESGHGNEATTYVIGVDKAGYYLVVDELGNGATSDAESALILKVIKNETITPKAVGAPTLDKVFVVSSTEKYGVTDKKVGDTVTYNLKATLPATGVYGKYSAYYLKFEDTLDAGLTLDKTSVKVYCEDTEITTATGVSIDTDTDQKLYVTITNTKATAIAAQAEDVIKVEYTATINSSVVKSGADNENTVSLQYSHDPNNSTEYSVLPSKKVTVWTFDFTLTKTFSDSQNHSAGFTLYRGTTAIGSEKTVSTNNGTLTWNDLEDGTYTLKETTPPTGFDAAADITFTITTTLSADGSSRQSMTSSNSAVTANNSTGDVTTTVQNKAGTSLPSTGGIGTTIFYVVGSVLVLGALVFMICKRRMKENA